MKVLFIGAHADDIELSCAATVVKMIEQDHEIRCVPLSLCGNSELKAECVESLGVLGVHKVKFGRFQVRNFNLFRQDILDYLIDVNKSFDPDLVFTHSAGDRHQDHCVVGEESLRAFKCSILTYTSQLNRLTGNDNYFVTVSDNQMAKKVQAIKSYRSQSHRPYCDPEIIYSTARVMGLKAGVKFAEGLEVIKMIN